MHTAGSAPMQGHSRIPIIRQVSASDIQSIASLEALISDDPWTADAYAGLYEKNDCVAAIAKPGGGDIAGYIWCRRAADELEIYKLGVHPDHRRRGIARKLVAWVLRKAAALELASVFLEVADSNSAARGLYDSAGFRIIARREKYYAHSGDDAIVMRYDIGSRD